MRMIRVRRVWPLALLWLTAVAGCGGKPPLTPVTGKVVYRGMPVPQGTVVFIPDVTKGERGPIAQGKIGPDGTFNLRTGESPGATAGWYRVTIAAVTVPPRMPNQPFAIPQSLLPPRYSDPELSQLVCEVKPNKANSIDFNLPAE